jgi:hypothetical protein
MPQFDDLSVAVAIANFLRVASLLGCQRTGDGNVCIGHLFGEAGVNNSTYIANVASTAQPVGGTIFGVTVDNNNGKLGFQPSSRRYKKDIKHMDKANGVEGIDGTSGH